MSDKKAKKNKTKNNKNIKDNKKVLNHKKGLTLRLDNNVEIPAKTI